MWRSQGRPADARSEPTAAAFYVTNSLYSAVDAQFYPEGIRGRIMKVDVNPHGGLAIAPNFFVPFQGERPNQIRLEGGDSSSDSFCYP
jgi:selenium-binding protein 1